MNLKKIFLYLFISSVSVSAVIGIFVILFGNFGEIESKILSTTASITVTSILGLACGAYFETGRGKVLSLVGIVLSVVTAILWIVETWYTFTNELLFFKSVGSSAILAAACALLSLISLARLNPKFIWSRYVLHAAVWLLSAISLWLIWFEPDLQGDLVPRVMGVLLIVIAALTITTPVFHKLSAAPADETAIDAEIEKLKKRLVELETQKAGFVEPDPDE